MKQNLEGTLYRNVLGYAKISSILGVCMHDIPDILGYPVRPDFVCVCVWGGGGGTKQMLEPSLCVAKNSVYHPRI